MRDNGAMTTPTPPPAATEDQPAAEALAEADAADAPDIADGIAAALQRELDQTGASSDSTGETNS